MGKLLVGAAKVSINPTEDMYPIPNKISDFGLEPMSQEAAYDEMNCRAIAIDTGKAKIMLLTFELAGASHRFSGGIGVHYGYTQPFCTPLPEKPGGYQGTGGLDRAV